MLAPDDADLVARDAAVPGLARVLDPTALADRLDDVLPGTAVESVETTYLRYKPATSCVVSLRVRHDRGVSDAYAKAHRRGDEHKAAKLLGCGRPPTSPADPGAVDLGDGVVVAFFPRDPELRMQRAYTDDVHDRLLRRLLPDRPDLWDGRPRWLSYKPERRHVARLDDADGPAAVLRWYAADRFPRALAAAGRFASDRTVRVPAVLGSCERDRVLAVEWLAGDALSRRLAQRRPEGAAAAGRALAALHDQHVPGLPSRPRAAEVEAQRVGAAAVGAVVPRLAPIAAWVAQHLATRWEGLPDVASPIHGDFSADQVVVEGGRVAIVDHDAAALGDPASDLGQFRANLLADVVSGRLQATAAQRGWDEFLRAYAAAGTADVLARVDPHTSAWLLRLAVEPFRRRRPGWAAAAERILCAAAGDRP